MSKELTLAKQIKALKPGKTFLVKSEYLRQKALKTAKLMKENEMISFDVVSRENEDGTFKVGAI